MGEESNGFLRRNSMKKVDKCSQENGLCGICHLPIKNINNNNLKLNKIFACHEGHILCEKCVERFSIQPDSNCFVCGIELKAINSNPLIFKADQNISNTWRNVGRTDSYFDYETPRNELNPSGIKINGRVECSRRPIHCPIADCARNIALSSLTHHFLFDHPEVPILSVGTGTKSTLIINLTSLSCDSSLCLAILLISRKLGTEANQMNPQINPKYRNCLPLAVLAARLHCTSHYRVQNNIEGHGETDMIVVWVAGLHLAADQPIRCHIEAADDEGVRSLVYTGPINSLRSVQKATEIFSKGDCLILHDRFLHCLTFNSNHFTANITIL